MIKYLIIFLFLSCSLTSFSQSSTVPFTLEDRDRIIRTEMEIKSLRNEMNTRFESMDTRFKSIDTKFEAQQKQLDNIYVLLFFILGAVFSLIGFVIWDRRTAIKPVQKEQENIVRALIDYSKKHTDLGEILKKTGVL